MQENLIPMLGIKISTMLAGLIGAFVTMLRKNEGSLQARLAGYFIAVATVLYLVPFLIWFLDWKFALVLHSSAENLMSFVCGMTSQKMTESFVDDPMGSVERWSKNARKVKRMVWNNEPASISPSPDADKGETK